MKEMKKFHELREGDILYENQNNIKVYWVLEKRDTGFHCVIMYQTPPVDENSYYIYIDHDMDETNYQNNYQGRIEDYPEFLL